MNRRILCSIALSATLALTTAVSYAQQPDPAPAQPAPVATPAPANQRTPEQMSTMLAKRLALTDDQKTQITPILADRQNKLLALKADTTSRPMKKGKQMKSIMEDADSKINAILTPPQQKQYAALEAQMKEQRKERKQDLQ